MTLPGSFAVELDPDARRPSERVAVRSGPGAAVRTTAAGAHALDVLLAGGPMVDATAKAGTDATPLVRVLLDAGIVNPRPRGEVATAADVTAVVPVRDGAADLGDLVTALDGLRVIVVDDGSTDGTAQAARAAGARVLHHDRSLGPAAARNTGVSAVETELVAFVDADCRPLAGWLDAVLPHFDDPTVAVVAPRIVAAASDGNSLTRYEAARSPLDQGPSPSAVGPGMPCTLVPTAALVCRRAALAEVGGLDPALRFGEDQDLVYRLAAAGWRIRYEPAALVAHDHRTHAPAFLRRRFGYGTPAGLLARRHGPLLAALSLPSPPRFARLHRDLVASGMPGRDARRVVQHTAVRTARTLAHAPTRTWLPIAAIAAWRSRPARAALAAALLARHLGDWRRRRPPVDPATWLAIRVADEGALAAGTWWGALRSRSLTPLLPALDRRPFTAPGDGALVEEVLWLP